MNRDVPDSLSNEANRAVLAHVEALSAHSDIASVLAAAVQPLGDVQTFCPDAAACRYVVVSTKGVIFGVALGMDTIAFRLDARMGRRALETGGAAYPACGPDWVAVVRHRPDDDWPAVDVTFWARKAYGYARETAAPREP